MLTLKDYAMGRDAKYPKEWTEEIQKNATVLLDKVNSLLSDLGITKVAVSSGWRPSAINSAIANAAKRSGHLVGKAIDLVDTDGKLKEAIKAKPDLLRKYDLFLEHPGSTPTWCHLDCVSRVDRPSRIFKP